MPHYIRLIKHTCVPWTELQRALASYQVVVLKVSLHCKACAGKVKKHLSKMEGELAGQLFLQDLTKLLFRVTYLNGNKITINPFSGYDNQTGRTRECKQA